MRTTPLACVLFASFALAANAFAACPGTTPAQGVPPGVPLPVFPATNWWNLDISTAPVDPNSAAYINWIGATRSPHPDFGGTDLDNLMLLCAFHHRCFDNDGWSLDTIDGVRHLVPPAWEDYARTPRPLRTPGTTGVPHARAA